MPGTFGRLRVFNSFLHPHAAGLYLNGSFHYFRNKCWAPKDLHNIYGNWDVLLSRIAFFAEDGGLVRIYGDDFVADRLQVFSHMEAGAHAIAGESDDRNRFAGIQYVRDEV